MQRIDKFITQNVIFEGPDLAGKTSFIQEVHKKTNYRWNVIDRSALSHVIYAKFYDRDDFFAKERLNKEIKDLNNRIVILLPPFEELARRFKIRGDEIQNLITLRQLHKLFSEAAEEFENYPNVIVVRNKDTSSYVESVISQIISLEMTRIYDLWKPVYGIARVSTNMEAHNTQLTFYDDCEFNDIDMSVLEYEPEKEYYNSIKNNLLSKIRNELRGINEYAREESVSSRRFVFAGTSCISFAQFMFRNKVLDCHFVLRSSNTKDTLKYDLQFLYILCKQVKDVLKIYPTACRIRVNFNSPHVIIQETGEQ